VRCLQAFYKWLQDDFNADALVHVGMHGTVEWCANVAHNTSLRIYYPSILVHNNLQMLF